MSPRTLGLMLLAVCSALAMAGTWLIIVLPAKSEAETVLSVAAQTLSYTSDDIKELVGEPFVVEAQGARVRLEQEERTLHAWVNQQYDDVDQFSARLTSQSPAPEDFRAASEFDCDELRREISSLTGREPPRPGSWPLHVPEFFAAGTEVDAARMQRDQQRLNLQRMFLLAAARCRAVPTAPPEFRALPRVAASAWDATEVQLHLGVEAKSLQALARALLAPGWNLRLRLVGFEFSPPAAEAQASAATPLLLVDARVVLERLRPKAE